MINIHSQLLRTSSSRLILFAIFSCLFSLRPVAALDLTLTADAMTFTAAPTTNLGNAEFIGAANGYGPGLDSANSYLQFSLSTLPNGIVGSQISRATLSLFVSSVISGGSIDVYRINSLWNEALITQLSAPSLGAPEYFGLSIGSGDLNQTVSVDLTTLVRGWVDGTIPNYGIAISSHVAGTAVIFDTKESSTTSHMPRIQVVLSTGGTTLSLM